MKKQYPLDDLVAARRLRLTMEGVEQAPRSTPARPLDVIAPQAAMNPGRRSVQVLARSAEKQEMIDALELGGMARRFA